MRGIGAEAAGASLVGDSGDRDVHAHVVALVQDVVPGQADVVEDLPELAVQAGRLRFAALGIVQVDAPLPVNGRHDSRAVLGNRECVRRAGRTVDTGHLVIDDTAGRETLYVVMSRGRERNTAYVVTERARAADLPGLPSACRHHRAAHQDRGTAPLAARSHRSRH